MPRRASSGISRGRIIGIAAVILAIALFSYLFLRILTGDLLGGSRGKHATELSVSEYLENANSLRGNVYRIRGTIEEQLKWTPNEGRLFSVEADHDGDTTPLPVRVPQEFSNRNIDRGGEFEFIVEVGKDGLLIARNIEKI